MGPFGEIGPLYQALGDFLNRHLTGGRAAIYTANHEAATLFGGIPERSIPLRNGALKGRLYRVSLEES